MLNILGMVVDLQLSGAEFKWLKRVVDNAVNSDYVPYGRALRAKFDLPLAKPQEIYRVILTCPQLESLVVLLEPSSGDNNYVKRAAFARRLNALEPRPDRGAMESRKIQTWL